jgi:hypothetical protein
MAAMVIAHADHKVKEIMAGGSLLPHTVALGAFDILLKAVDFDQLALAVMAKLAMQER